MQKNSRREHFCCISSYRLYNLTGVEMKITNLAHLSENEFAELEKELAEHKTLGQVLTWTSAKPQSDFLPQIVAEVVTQDEFTHDVIIPYKNLFLVYDTT
jgi:hypothetical protein